MKRIKQKILRRISFTYRELSKLLGLPEGEFTMGVWEKEINY